MMTVSHDSTRGALWAIVPFKGFAFSKQRLAPHYTPGFRRGLAMAMLEDVLDILSNTPGIDGVLLVTRDAAAWDLAHEHGAVVYAEQCTGLNEAAMEACGYLHDRAKAGAGVLVVPADIPGAQVVETEAIVATLRGGADYVIAPSLDRGGSNAIAMKRPGCVPFCYGTDSFARHIDIVHGHGMAATVLDLPGIALDIDTPQDCQLFLERPSSTRTWSFLAGERERGATHGYVNGSLRCDNGLNNGTSMVSSKRP